MTTNKEIIEKRILEEWKINVDLQKFHDQLKQQRFTHFLAIQTAFFGIYALLIRESYVQCELGLSLISTATSITALIIVSQISKMDRRARAFIDVVKSRLLLLESEWNNLYPNNKLATYSEQFDVLVRHEESTIERYISCRDLGNQDGLLKYIKEAAAHKGEENIIKTFNILWWILFFASIFIGLFLS